MTMQRNTITCADIFDLCAQVEPQSVDMILCDLPYGTTACTWDSVIPFAPMWDAFKRLIKPRGAIVLTASQPFTSLLVCSNLAWFRYEWIWEKTMGTGFLNAPIMPLKTHDNVLTFYGTSGSFNPVLGVGVPYRAKTGIQPRDTIRDKNIAGVLRQNTGTRHPRSVIIFENETGLHPTQKPVALFEYLIRTYTRPGDLVFDPCVGSGTTALAARNCGRDYIVGDCSPEYVAIAQKRLDAPYTLPLIPETMTAPAYETLPMELEECAD